QAEDGIRDFHVTGVQTCALPICPLLLSSRRSRPEWNAASGSAAAGSLRTALGVTSAQSRMRAVARARSLSFSPATFAPWFMPGRSEERRVGDDRRPRWALDDSNI